MLVDIALKYKFNNLVLSLVSNLALGFAKACRSMIVVVVMVEIVLKMSNQSA